MKRLIFFFLHLTCFSSFYSWSSTAAGLGDYKSTDNSGMGKQERLIEIESYLAEIGKYTQDLEKRMKEEGGEKLKSLEGKLMAQEKEIQDLKSKLVAQEGELARLNQIFGGMTSAELVAMKAFVDKMASGDWEKMQNEIEGLKLTDRSMEAVIQSMQATPSR